jgi:hypothetical protein
MDKPNRVPEPIAADPRLSGRLARHIAQAEADADQYAAVGSHRLARIRRRDARLLRSMQAAVESGRKTAPGRRT